MNTPVPQIRSWTVPRPLFALIAASALLFGCVTDEVDDSNPPQETPEPEPQPEPEPEPEPQPEPEPEPEMGCDAFCAAGALATINACFTDPGETIAEAECLEICEDEDLSAATACLLEAGDDCEAADVCLADPDIEPVTFQVEGADAIMTGVIDARAIEAVESLIAEHPEVERIVLLDVPGSMDDVSNLRAARLVREAGLATHVPGDGTIASGGVDFFTAGRVRTADVAGGARLGVHSWGGDGFSGAELPMDHPEHERYLSFYREMGIPEGFYWFTLQAAPVEDIHWMTEGEVSRYGLVTE